MIRTRLTQLFWAWGLVGLVYTFSPLLAWANPIVIPNTSLDHLIDWQPIWLGMYLSFFILIPWVFLSLPLPHLAALRRSMHAIAAVSLLFFVMVPSTINYPIYVLNTTSQSPWLWDILHQLDHTQQCLPSLHASLTTVCCLAWQSNAKPPKKWAIGLWWWLMIYSILACKRHLFWDTGAGVLLGAMAYQWVFLPQLTKVKS